MAHEITMTNGRAEAAFAFKPAWHGLGAVLDHAMLSGEALEAANLNWLVVQRQMAYSQAEQVETPEGPVSVNRYHDLPGQLCNVREDTGLFLGAVTDRYQVVQNREAFQFLDALVDDGQLTYESAFSLGGGKRVCLLARMPGMDFVSDNDGSLRYILMGLHHDGSGAIRFGATSVRVVCANTYGLALRKDGQTVRELSIRHTGDIKEKLAEAKIILGLANKSFDEHAETCQKLRDCVLTREQWAEFIDVMAPVPLKSDPDWTARREREILETRQSIQSIFRTAETSLVDGAENTAWAAFNAVTQHIDHLPRRGADAGRKAEARFNVTQYGPGRDQKERAFQTACRLAAIA